MFPWQTEELAQCSQPHPQEDLPFFLFFIMFLTIKATIARSTRPVITVPMTSRFHGSCIHAVFFGGSHEHIYHEYYKGNCYNQSYRVNISGKE